MITGLKKHLFFSILLCLVGSKFLAQLDSIPLQTVIQKGHQKPINVAVFSPNGQYIASGAKDNIIKLWDVDLGYEIRSFHRHTSQIYDLSFSTNGLYIASCGADNKVFVHHIVTGKLIQEITITTGQVWQVFFSSNQKYIITSSTRGSLCVWNLKNGSLVKEFAKSYSGHIGSSGQQYKQPIVPNITNSKQLDLINFETLDTVTAITLDKVYSYSFRPDDKYLAVGSKTLQTTIIDIDTKNIVKTLRSDTINKCDGCNTKVLFSNKGKYLISGSKTNGLTLWHGSTFKKMRTFTIKKGIRHLEFSHDDNYLLISSDNEVKVFNVKTGRAVYDYQSEYFNYFKPHFSSKVNAILIPSSNHTMSLVSFLTKENKKRFSGYLNQPKTDGLGLKYSNWFHESLLSKISMKSSVGVSPNGQWIAKGNVDSTVFIINLENGRLVKRLQGHSKSVFLMKFSHDGKFLATGGGDRYIILWNTESWKPIAYLRGHVEKIFDFNFSKNDQLLISSGWDGYIITWDISTGQSIDYQTFRDLSAYTVGFANNDLYTIHGDLNNEITISEYDSRKPYKKLVGHTGLLSDYCFDAQKITMFTSSWDGSVRIWDFASGLLLAKHKLHAGGVYSLAYNNTSKCLFSGGADNEIVVWNTEKKTLETTLKGHKNSVTSLNLTSDNRYLISCSADGEVIVWDVDERRALYTYQQINNKDWLVTHTKGYFDGSAEALKLMTYVKGLRVVPISSLFKKYYTPNLAKRIMVGEDFALNTMDIQNDFAVPKLDIDLASATNLIIKSDSGIISKAQTIHYDITANSLTSEVKTVAIYKNQKLVKQVILPKGKVSTQKNVSVYLRDGKNELTFVATNTSGLESIPITETIWFDGEKGKTDLYVFAIGINTYEKENYKLNYAVHDAQAFIKNIDNGFSSSLFNEVHHVLIKNDKAKKQNVLKTLEMMSQEIGPEDVFVFFYAGHGVMSTDESSSFYLVMHDVLNMYGDSDQLFNKGISGTELMTISKSIAAEKQLYILDACQSGGALQAFASRGFGREKALAQLARSTGTFFLTASQDLQYANESNELKHGVFTYSLLEVLKGNDFTSAQDEKITVSELKTYAEERVPELSKKYQGYVQYPTSYGFGQDFPLVILKK